MNKDCPSRNSVTFVKWHGAESKRDWIRVKALYDSSRRDVSYLAPKPLELSQSQETITYSHLPEGDTLQGILLRKHRRFATESDREQLQVWLWLAGKALADFHRVYALDVHEAQTQQLTGIEGILAVDDHQTLIRSPVVHFHGDFCAANIWIEDEKRQLWIFDPIPSRFCSLKWDCKISVYYDIGHMASSLWAVYPLKLAHLINWSGIDELIEAFCRGYEVGAGVKLNRRVVFAMALWLLDGYKRVALRSGSVLTVACRKIFLQRRYASLKRRIQHEQLYPKP